VAAGFEHSIANMYFLPVALLIKDLAPEFAAETGLDLSALTWGNFLWKNLLPVTLGNVLGGSVLVASVYWFVYLRNYTPENAEPSRIASPNGREPSAPSVDPAFHGTGSE
jgi:formate transporter